MGGCFESEPICCRGSFELGKYLALGRLDCSTSPQKFTNLLAEDAGYHHARTNSIHPLFCFIVAGLAGPWEESVSTCQMERNASALYLSRTNEIASHDTFALPQSISSLSPSYHRWRVKRWLERMLAVVGLVVTSPFMLLLVLAVRANSRGGAIYWQERLGLNGHVFEICKLRTMVEDAEQWTGAVWAQRDDPRATSLGRLLRRCHLDELPQLWNIALGQMSFIGPRPERPEIATELASEIPGFAHRLAVLPGVTGLAQVNLMPDETVDCVRRKLELDLEYVFTAEPFLDLRILGCTVLKMMGVPQRMAARLFRVSRTPAPAKLATPTAVYELSLINASRRTSSDPAPMPVESCTTPLSSAPFSALPR